MPRSPELRMQASLFRICEQVVKIRNLAALEYRPTVCNKTILDAIVDDIDKIKTLTESSIVQLRNWEPRKIGRPKGS